MNEEPDEKRIEELLDSYRQFVKNLREALEIAGVPKRLLFFYIFVPPNMEGMMPEDVVDFYRRIRKAVVIQLWKVGLSQREIAKRLGGGSYHIVVDSLKEVKSSQTKHADTTPDGKDDKTETQ